MKYFLCFCICLLSFLAKAQHRVVFKIKKYPQLHKGDKIFIAGNFNSWNPGNADYKFEIGWDYELSLQLAAGQYEYKCTRGDWAKVECQADGKDIANRSFAIGSDTTIEINIDSWKDDFPTEVKRHTASRQVHILDTAFFIPQLNRTRRIWVYLPENYPGTKKHYPVLYMHDGQNLFDRYTADNEEWEVDEILDSLVTSGRQACIVVGIDNGQNSRLSEYNLYPFELNGAGNSTQTFLPEGKEYIEFLSQTLKPYIDKKYRTLTSRENTIIAGSSMGGLISYYAMLLKPGVFGKAGIFSPSFWTNPSIRSFTDSLSGKVDSKFFFYAGARESNTMVVDMQAVQDELGETSSAMVYSVTDPEGRHNAAAWRKWFAEFYNWMMADGFNIVIKLK